MSLITLPKMDHSKKSIHKALGLSAYQKNFIFSVILFELLSSKMMAEELYDNIEEAPLNLIASSGILEKAVDRVTTLEEQIFLIYTFDSIYGATYRTIQDIAERKEKKKKASDISEAFSDFVSQMKAAPIAHAIKLIRECNHDFGTFIDKLLPYSRAEEMERAEEAIENGDIDNFIDGLKGQFGDPDED